MPTFTAEKLRKITADIFGAVGVPQKEADILSQHLVEANLAGVDSHGVIRIPQYVKSGRSSPPCRLCKKQPTTSSYGRKR